VSLSGSVEDLPLLEILQVVSFCQKTGHLTVRAEAGEAAVVFDSGRVVAGYAWDVPPLPPGDPAPGPERERVVRGRVASILEKLVRLRDGSFAFTLSQEVETALAGRDLAGEMLPGGINPEELMLDLAKKLDEDRRDATAVLEASFAAPVEEMDLGLEELLEEDPIEPGPGAMAPPAAVPAAAPQAAASPKATAPALSGPRVLVVDDEPDVRRVLRERLAAASYHVTEASDLVEARSAMKLLAGGPSPFLLVVDLGLPSSGGASFRGGMDVARYATGLSSPPRVLLMAETIDEKLRKTAKRSGVSLVAWKPGLSKLDPLQYEADLRAFGDKLARDLLPRLDGRRAATPAFGMPKLTALPTPPEAALKKPDTAEMARNQVLDAALMELQSHPDPDMVAFLLMRAARLFFPRFVLFLVRDERLRGLGGAGQVASGASLDLLARELSVSLETDSPFADAVALGQPWSGPLPADGPLRAMVDRLGSLGATSAAVLPVRAQHETIAVVYGDAPGGAALPDLEPLAAFTRHAGRALDAALVERRSAAQPA
jgi:CheY-like chemotaxis protein